jgi:hypothetical protein
LERAKYYRSRAEELLNGAREWKDRDTLMCVAEKYKHVAARLEKQSQLAERE